MAITNLHLGKTLTGEPLQLRDIERGTKAHFPSGAGGVLESVCTECTDTHAIFESTDKEWPRKWTIDLAASDMSLAELEALADALRAFGSMSSLPTDEQRAIVQRASTLGYASARSFTQASWTQKGVLAKKELTAVYSAAIESHEALNSLLLKAAPAELVYELRDTIDEMSYDEKCAALKNVLTMESLGK